MISVEFMENLRKIPLSAPPGGGLPLRNRSEGTLGDLTPILRFLQASGLYSGDGGVPTQTAILHVTGTLPLTTP